MRKIRFLLTVLLGALVAAMSAPAQAADLQNVLYLDLASGRVVIEMRPDLAPAHVARIKELVRQKFYDGLTFHRVIEGFMAQTGDPQGDGTGGSGQNIKAEFNKEPFLRGAVGMAHTSASVDSADSQFFICFEDSRFLDGKYTYWGKVVSGMEFVDKIKKGEDESGMVDHPDKIVRMQVAADADKAQK